MSRGVRVSGAKSRFFGWSIFRRDPEQRSAPPMSEKRRAPRIPASMPVLIYGRFGNEPFQENTETINVSANGGLMPISAPIRLSQTLLLTNLQTEEDLACRVARLVKTGEGETLAALEFLRPPPRFWRRDFATGL